MQEARLPARVRALGQEAKRRLGPAPRRPDRDGAQSQLQPGPRCPPPLDRRGEPLVGGSSAVRTEDRLPPRPDSGVDTPAQALAGRHGGH